VWKCTKKGVGRIYTEQSKKGTKKMKKHFTLLLHFSSFVWCFSFIAIVFSFFLIFSFLSFPFSYRLFPWNSGPEFRNTIISQYFVNYELFSPICKFGFWAKRTSYRAQKIVSVKNSKATPQVPPNPKVGADQNGCPFFYFEQKKVNTQNDCPFYYE